MFASKTVLDCGVLSGRHVRLEPLGLHHLDGLVAAASGPRDSFQWTSLPADAAQMHRYVEATLAASASGAAVPFATIDAATGKVVGSTRFANLEHHQLPIPGQPDGLPSLVEIGWTWLAASAQRTGINTEAKLLMLTHAFEQWRLIRVVLKTHEKNERSRAAMERIGAQFDGVRRTFPPDVGPRPTAWYSMGAADWQQCKARLVEKLQR